MRELSQIAIRYRLVCGMPSESLLAYPFRRGATPSDSMAYVRTLPAFLLVPCLLRRPDHIAAGGLHQVSVQPGTPPDYRASVFALDADFISGALHLSSDPPDKFA
ncbi:hypothetical protein VTO73DRAFT_7415 [Trametes versicolor]